MDLEFHHVGVACFDIEETCSFYEKMGYERSETIIDTLQNIKICFLSNDHLPVIELLAPVDEKSPVNRILKSVGVSPYHFCYEVNDIETAIKEMRKEHFMIVSRPIPACAMENKKVCFLYSKVVGLIELVEK